MERRRNIGGFVIVTVIVTFLLGGVLGWMAEDKWNLDNSRGQETSFVPGIGGGPDNQLQNQNNFSTNISDFRVRLNSLFKEHTVLTSEYLTKFYDGEVVSILENQLDQNKTSIAEVLGNVYGEDSEKMFLQMWEEHLEQYSSYIQAIKDDNEQEANSAKEELENIADRMGEMMVGLHSNFSSQTITTLMNEHVRLTLNIIDAHVDGDSAKVAESKKGAFNQAGVFADYIGQVIASSNPERIP